MVVQLVGELRVIEQRRDPFVQHPGAAPEPCGGHLVGGRHRQTQDEIAEKQPDRDVEDVDAKHERCGARPPAYCASLTLYCGRGYTLRPWYDPE